MRFGTLNCSIDVGALDVYLRGINRAGQTQIVPIVLVDALTQQVMHAFTLRG